MIERVQRNWTGLAVSAAIIVLSSLARLPYVRQANLSPDAADYINIARNLARGRGLIHSIKWHFFTADRAVHSAVGERPLLYPLLIAPFCRSDYPARACERVNVFLAALAAALGAVWAVRLGLTARATAIATALVAFNAGLAMCSVYPLTEPLYLVWLFGIVLIVGRDNDSPRAARLAAVLTALAYLTRPSAAAIAVGLSLWYGRRRAFRALSSYLLTLFVLLLPWWVIVAIARGSPFYSVQGFHLVVEDIRDGMAVGYGVAFPRPIEFLFAHAATVLTTIAGHTVAYIEQLFGPTYLSIFSVFVFLRLFRRRDASASLDLAADGPAYAIAFFHFALTAATWATFDNLRFMTPCFALLIVPAVAEMDALVGRLPKRRARVAAGTLVLGVAAFLYTDQWAQLYNQVRDGRERDLSMQVARIEFDRLIAPNATVACHDPFSMNYYSDRPTVMLPDAADPAERVQKIERFLDDYRPDCLAFVPAELQAFGPLIRAGRLAPLGRLQAVDLEVVRVLPPPR